jgi:uncharacterized protein (DUF302 family)
MEPYGRRVVVDLPFELTLTEVLRALQDETIEVIGRCDVRRLLEHTLQQDCRRYVLLDVMSPSVALDALRHDVSVGAVLPATIAVFELADGETAVVVAEPFGGLGSEREWRRTAPYMAALADQACEQLARAVSRFQHAARRHASRSSEASEQFA